MQKPMIGILAGMGPKSSAPFLEHLISESEKILKPKSDLDYPPILMYSLPNPYSTNKPFDPELMKKQYVKDLKN